MEDVTVCIPTIERPECLAALLDSVRRIMPTSPILVADQGREFPAGEVARDFGARVDDLPYDCGVCAARNHLVKAASTRYVFMLDDDMIMHEETHPEVLREVLSTSEIDLVSPALGRSGENPFVFRGLLRKSGGILITDHGWNRGIELGCEIVDFTFCVFMAKRDRLELVPWDERLKTAELMEWYWRAKDVLRIAQSTKSKVEHRAAYPDHYARFRGRIADQTAIANEILGIRTRRGFHHRKAE